MMVAVLLANSVKQAMKAVMSMTATAGGTWARGCKWFPIHIANPDSYCQKKVVKVRLFCSDIYICSNFNIALQ